MFFLLEARPHLYKELRGRGSKSSQDFQVWTVGRDWGFAVVQRWTFRARYSKSWVLKIPFGWIQRFAFPTNYSFTWSEFSWHKRWRLLDISACSLIDAWLRGWRCLWRGIHRYTLKILGLVLAKGGEGTELGGVLQGLLIHGVYCVLWQGTQKPKEVNPGLSLGCNLKRICDVEVLWTKRDETILHRKLAEASSTHSLHFCMHVQGTPSGG